MSARSSFAVSSATEAARALEYFNGFHDGFIKRVVLDSRDEIAEDLSQSCTGVFDAGIDFAHYNYADGAKPFHPHNQIIRATFRNVQNIVCEFREEFPGNTIIGLFIAPATRRKGGQTTSEPCLGLRLARHVYVEEGRRYDLTESQLFTFTDATFVELSLP
jgi:hypothetical protein